MKKPFSLISSLILSTMFCISCNNSVPKKDDPQKETNPYENIDRTFLNGIDEPLVYDVQVNNFDLEKTIDLAHILGCKSFRLRIQDGYTLLTKKYDFTIKAKVDKAISLMKKYGIRPIGQCSVFPNDSDFTKDSPASVPRQNDKAYKSYMEKVEEHWRIISSTFPDVLIWEMGNEFNSNVFFHPNGYKGSFLNQTDDKGFGFTESAHIVTDYMYHANKGIHEGNPKARSMMFNFFRFMCQC